ncbi:hypothetical protein [Streptomyces tsukubensis]|uniref:hypothetical protein n=1 Tax=Streptomyces tsukubensis TaxID=83656 RepID=UPI00344C4D8C
MDICSPETGRGGPHTALLSRRSAGRRSGGAGRGGYVCRDAGSDRFIVNTRHGDPGTSGQHGTTGSQGLVIVFRQPETHVARSVPLDHTIRRTSLTCA